MWLETSWLMWIVAGVFLNLSLNWKAFLPFVIHDALLYGKLKKKAGSVAPVTAPWSGILNVPKRWFTHFYAWGVAWNYSIFALYLVRCVAGSSVLPGAVLSPLETLTEMDFRLVCMPGGGLSQRQFEVALVLCLVCVQVARRLYECLFVSVFSPDGKMHVLHYAVGFYFYTVLGPTALLHLKGSELKDEYRKEFSIHWNHVLGVALFVLGSWHQLVCHKILASLRQPKQTEVTKGLGEKEDRLRASQADLSSYSLPRGDWFEYVSCPHYFSEMVLYAGCLLVLITGDVWSSWWLVLVFTCSTLTLSARQMHNWYLEKFEDYPKARKIVVPGLY